MQIISDIDQVLGQPVEVKLYAAKAALSFGYPKDSKWQIRVNYPQIVFIRFDGKTIGTATVTPDTSFDSSQRSIEMVLNMQLNYHDGARIEIGEGTLCAKAQFSLITSVPPTDAFTKAAGQNDGLVVYEMLGAIELVRSGKDPQIDGRVTFA